MTQHRSRDEAETPPVVPTEYITCPGANPHPVNAALRCGGAVHKVDYPAGAEAFVVVDYESVASGLSDPRLSKRIDKAPAWFRAAIMDNSPSLAHNMLLTDPPEHARLRAPVGRALTAGRIERLRPHIQDTTDDLIDAFPGSGEVDLINAFAYILPALVVCELIGIPVQDRTMFQQWSQTLSESPGDPDASQRANDQAVTYIEELLVIRRKEPRDDLITDLMRAADDGVLNHQELVSTLVSVTIAGHKTTTNLIGNGMYALLSHPDQLELLRSDPQLMPSAIEEFLRYEGPVDRGTLRVAVENIRLGQVDIPKESFVHLSLTAANHDPAVFPDPDRLDITRTPNRHMSFGPGTHNCAGSGLARLEGHIAFSTLLRRLPDIELAVPPGDITWRSDTSVSRGLEALPIRVKRRLPRYPVPPGGTTDGR